MSIEIKSTTKITAVKPRKQGGTKQKFHALIPKKGSISVAALSTKAKKELEINPKKVEGWLRGFLRRGLIKLH